jgi:hypothetical protein
VLTGGVPESECKGIDFSRSLQMFYEKNAEKRETFSKSGQN